MAEKEKQEELEKQENAKKDTEKKEKEENKTEEMVSKQDYDELDDRYKRILAEFENFKKRNSKEREGLYNSML